MFLSFSSPGLIRTRCKRDGQIVGAHMDQSNFFSSVDDHLLAMLFSHLSGYQVARLSCVCSRWRDVVQGVDCDENIWNILWKRDFEPLELDSPAATPWKGAPSSRLLYARMASVDQLSHPEWKRVYPINGQRTVMDRQGSSAAVLNGCPVVYGGWTSGNYHSPDFRCSIVTSSS